MTLATDLLNLALPTLAMKAPCRAATTAAITLSALQTIDGVSLAESDRVLVKDQADGTENGIYNASAGAWSREPDFDGSSDATRGTLVRITDGTTNQDAYYEISTESPIVIGTTDISFTQVNDTLLDVSTFAQTLLDDTSDAVARITLDILENVLTTEGDIVYQGASGAERLAAGSNTQLLKVASGLPSWQNEPTPAETLKGFYIRGGLVTRNALDKEHDLDIAPLSFRDKDDSQNFISSSIFTKKLDQTFVKGSGNGGMATGAFLPTNNYLYLFAVKEDITGDVDFMADTNTIGSNIVAYETDWSIIKPPMGRDYLVHWRTDDSDNLVDSSRLPGGFGDYVLLEYLDIPFALVNTIIDFEPYWDFIEYFEIECWELKVGVAGGGVRFQTSDDRGATYQEVSTDYVSCYSRTRGADFGGSPQENFEFIAGNGEFGPNGSILRKERLACFITMYNTEDSDEHTRMNINSCSRLSTSEDFLNAISVLIDPLSITTTMRIYHGTPGSDTGGHGKIYMWGKVKGGR